MAACDNSSDCRNAYRCRRANQLGMIPISSASNEQSGEVVVELQPLARSLDRDSAKFCTVDVPVPAIGGPCETALDCNRIDEIFCDEGTLTEDGYCTTTGCEKQSCPEVEKICDPALTEDGYCTTTGCEKGQCPEGAVCVRFAPEDEGEPIDRCMASCIDDFDCRDGLVCLDAGKLQRKAESLDGEEALFCAVVQ